MTEIALDKADNFNVRTAAVRKLTDQSTLTEIVLDNAAPSSVREARVREAAVYNLTDPVMLAKVAFKTGYFGIILKKFTVSTMLESLANINNNRRAQLIYKYIRAFDSVPEEHRPRLINSIFPAIKILDKTEYLNKFGEIVSVKIDWSSKTKQYSGPAGSMTLPGESIECSIKFMNLSESVSHRWSTNFPRNIITTRKNLGFSPAEIKAWDLYGPVRKLLSQ